MAHVSPGQPSSGLVDANEYGQAEAYELFEVENVQDHTRKPEARALLSDVESKTSLEDEVLQASAAPQADEFSMDEMVARVSISELSVTVANMQPDCSKHGRPVSPVIDIQGGLARDSLLHSRRSGESGEPGGYVHTPSTDGSV